MPGPKGKTYRVSAAAREGFLDRRRAGEAWPRGNGNSREVFVLDAAADPPERKLEDGRFAIGQDTFAILKKDPEIFIDGADRGGNQEVESLRGRVVAAERRVVELEAVMAKDPEKAAMLDRIEELEDLIAHDSEKAALKAHVVELEALLAKETDPGRPSDPAKPAGLVSPAGGSAK